jgi:hypothetical protein
MRVYGEVMRKMMGLDQVDPAAAEAVYGRFADKNTVVRVEPENVISWDHRKLGGRY